MTPLVVGNWKMHGTQADCAALAREIMREVDKTATSVKVAIAPPFTALAAVKRELDTSSVALAAQNCHWEERGAFTGEVSPAMLREIGCEFVIVGHSERRHIFGEDDSMIARKLPAVFAAGMHAILCVGETLDERESGHTFQVIERQLSIALKQLDKGVIEKIAVAYEPVWAIGTGRNATPAQVSEVHKYIREFLANLCGSSLGATVPILYGGSVKPENAGELARTPEVGGLLVGGASLKAETFLPIVSSFITT